MFGIDYILAPHSLEDFLATFWGQRAVHIKGEADKFGELFGWQDINHLLSHGRLTHPAVSLVLEKKTLPANALAQVEHWLAQGATLVLNQIQELDPIVDRFASALANDLNTGVGVNCYASWPSKQGFDIHYDLHDVFVVQIAGKKTWKVFEPTRRWPIEREKGRLMLTPPDAQPYLECSLTAGDVLHIPRGHWHYAVADTPSIDLTVGPKARTGVDFLLWLADHVMNSEEFFRKDFPLVRARALGGDRPEIELESHWRELAERLRALLAGDDLLEGFLRAGVVANRIRRSYQLPELVTLREQITPETRFVLAPHQKALVPESESPSMTVIMRGHVVNFENVPERLLRAFFERPGDVRAADLMAACPELGEEQVRGFLLQLFERGVLQLADEAGGEEESA